MILKTQVEGPFYDPSVLIPAIFENGLLEIKNNGVSEVFFGKHPIEFDVFNTDAFQLFGMNLASRERPFFIAYEGRIPLGYEISDSEIKGGEDSFSTMWELFYVYSKRKIEPNGQVKRKALQYTCIRHCRPGTMFCKCDECGGHFVITPQTIQFYQDRKLVIPTIRCPKCIQKKRIRYSGKKGRLSR